jgi:hypothetical protein
MSILTYTFKGNELRFTSEERGAVLVHAQCPIDTILNVGYALVILTEPAPKSCDNRNVYAINASGHIL